MTENERQGRLILERRWLTQAEVSAAWRAAEAAGVELGGWLYERGRIDAPQLAALRPPSSAGLLGSHRATARSGEAVGRRLGDFVLEAELSRGGMGVIYRGRSLLDGRLAAIKLMLSSDPENEERRRFEREIRALSQIDHPHIVKVLEVGESDGQPWFAMELIEGQTLTELVEASLRETGSPPPPDLIVDQISAIAEALSYCHARAVVHRDVKPDNILIEAETERAVLVDFGLIKRDETRLSSSAGSIGLTVTQTREFVGTPAYMSPEQVDPSGPYGKVTELSDVWALGATLAYGLTGEAPFAGETIPALISAILNQPVRGPRARRASLEPWLDELCVACLAREAVRRPRMEELVDGLRRGDEGALARRLTRWAAGLSLVGLAVVAAGVGAWLWRGPPKLTAFEARNARRVADVYYTSAPTLQVAGAASRSGAWVEVGGAAAPCGGDGAFELSVPLAPGRNAVSVAIRGAEAPPRELLVVRDEAPPRISLNAPQRGAVYVFEDRLAGRIEDASPVEMRIGEASIAVDAGAFSVSCDDRGGISALELHAKDAAGQVAVARLRAISARSLERLVDGLLGELRAWTRASSEERELVVAELSHRLGTGWRFDGLAVYAPEEAALRPPLASWVHLDTGLSFVLIPGGRGLMGTPDGSVERAFVKDMLGDEGDYVDRIEQELPQHEVLIEPFLMGQLEVDQQTWERFGGEQRDEPRGALLPAHGLTWNSAQAWIESVGGGLRLPSEAEWEYACRAGTRTRFFWGDDFEGMDRYVFSMTNTKRMLQSTRAHLEAGAWNAFGLCDTIGNAWEFVEDDFSPNYKDGPMTSKALRRDDGVLWMRGVRGGSVISFRGFLRSAARSYHRPELERKAGGFRVARSLPPPRS